MSGAGAKKERDDESVSLEAEEVEQQGSAVELRAPSLTRLGRYRVVREIASGGMASVNLAVADGLDKLVALKVIHPHLAREESFVAMFLDEARIASSISHRNVCSVFDFGECDGHYYIAMDYLAGESLRDVNLRVKHSVLDAEPHKRWAYTAYVLAEACEGLHAAHELRGPDEQLLDVVHRDVSPHNLFITYDGNVQVVDFGIARAANRVQHTATGILKGKFSYMAPEQVRQQQVDRRADVWALGICLWESLTLRRLFLRATQADTLMSVLVDPIVPPSQLCPGLPKELDEITMRALTRDVNQRYPTARALGQALMAYCRASGVGTGPVEVEQWMERLFAEEITQKRRLVRSALAARTNDASWPDAPVGALPRTPTHSGARLKRELQPSPSDLEALSHEISWQVQAASHAPNTLLPWQRWLSGRPWLGAALALLGAVALGASLRGGSGPAPAEVPSPAVTAPAAGVVAGEAPRPPAVAQPREDIAARPSVNTQGPAPSAAEQAPPASQGAARGQVAPTRAPQPAPRALRPPARPRPRVESASADPAVAPNPYDAPAAKASAEESDPSSAREAIAQRAPDPSHAAAEATQVAAPAVLRAAPPVMRSATVAEPAPASSKSLPADKPADNLPLRAEVSVADLTVEGSLGSGVISRMLSRAVPLIRKCYVQAAQQAGRNDFSPLAITLTIDEAGAARDIRAGNHGLSKLPACVGDALRRLRSDIKPDVGTVRVRFNVALRAP